MGKKDRKKFARMCSENSLMFVECYDHDCMCSVIGLRSYKTLALVRMSDFRNPDWPALESLVAECVLLEVFGE